MKSKKKGDEVITEKDIREAVAKLKKNSRVKNNIVNLTVEEVYVFLEYLFLSIEERVNPTKSK